MHGFRDNEVFLPTGYDVIVISTLGALQEICNDGLWESYHDFLIVFRSNFSSGMCGFRDNEVLLQGGCDVILIYPLGGASGDFFTTESERATMTSR